MDLKCDDPNVLLCPEITVLFSKIIQYNIVFAKNKSRLITQKVDVMLITLPLEGVAFCEKNHDNNHLNYENP